MCRWLRPMSEPRAKEISIAPTRAKPPMPKPIGAAAAIFSFKAAAISSSVSFWLDSTPPCAAIASASEIA